MTRRSPVVEFLVEKPVLLVVGALAAVVWANLAQDSYEHAVHPLHFAVNDIAMVFFFALATKEVFESTLPGGALESPRRAAVPLIAAIGGMAVPALMYLSLTAVADRPDLARGWAIPSATDIAFSYLAATSIFPRGHPAMPFLLLLAIADDALGLLILAVFYPTGDVAGVLFGILLAVAMVFAWGLKRYGVTSFWAYLLGPSIVSWAAFYYGGLHPALAMVPIVPLMPHAKRDFGIYADREGLLPDTLNRFEHWWRLPVQVILFLFGLVNAGVSFGALGAGTWIVLTSLVIGKPIGITLFTLASALIGLRRPPGLSVGALVVLGFAAGIGFTVALFFATAAFPAGAALQEAKMGALLSVVGGALAFIVGKALDVGGQSDKTTRRPR
jgi:NhaA family Na+:H+ antiporter